MTYKSQIVKIGNIHIGGNHPVIIQSMTNTDSENITATANQIIDLAKAGSEIVRLTVNTDKAAKALPFIRDIVYEASIKESFSAPPLVGDFHYNGHRLLQDNPDCAKALDKYRINPGNVGFGSKHDPQFDAIIEQAITYQTPVRIGVNWGSVDPSLAKELMDENAKQASPKSATELLHDTLILSALSSAKRAETLGLNTNQIVLSCKVSRVPDLITIYQRLAQSCDYALHLGLTEAGMGSKGIIATTAALSILLQQNIGATIRASLTPEPGASRCKEVEVCQQIIQSLEYRSFTPSVTACPGCGRTTSTYFQTLASDIESFIHKAMPQWKKTYPGVEKLKLAVMGCIVNGPGESKHADIGISLPGSGESPVAPVFIDGKKTHTLRGDNISEEFQSIVSAYIHDRFVA